MWQEAETEMMEEKQNLTWELQETKARHQDLQQAYKKIDEKHQFA